MLSEGRQRYLDRLFSQAKEAHSNAMTSPWSVAQYNSFLLRTLEAEFAANPGFDIAARLNPELYAQKLQTLRDAESEKQAKQAQDHPSSKRVKCGDQVDPTSVSGRLRGLRTAEEVIVKSPLSSEVTELLCTDPSSEISPSGIVSILSNAEVLFQCPGGKRRMVLRLSKTVVVKIVPARENDGRESSALGYLHNCLPELSVPRLLGEIQIKQKSMIFMSYVPGEELDKIWPSLDHDQKQALARDLDTYLSLMRSHRPIEGQPYGGCGGQKCLDQRRRSRRSDQPIFNSSEFQDFFFSNPHYGSNVWITFLRKFYELPDAADGSSDKYVFTHGDLRLANIMVNRNNDGAYHISGIIDWEFSGWYPAWWEAVKLTNCIGPLEEKDWLLYVPDVVSPLRSPIKYLLNSVWDDHVE